MNIKSILAWFSGLFTKGKTMADETLIGAAGSGVALAAPEMTVNDLQASLAPAAESIAQALAPAGEALAGVVASAVEAELVAAAGPAAPIVAAVVNTDVLKAVLLALGHNLESVWEEAVALAKKAL